MSSRERDVAFLDEQAQGVLQDIEGINQRFQAWNQQQTDHIQEILRAAGVLEQINGIEDSRKEMQQKAQGQIDEQKAQLTDLQKIKMFLVQRAQAEAEEEARAQAEEDAKQKAAQAAPPSVPIGVQDPLGIGQPRVLSEMEVLTGKPGQGEFTSEDKT